MEFSNAPFFMIGVAQCVVPSVGHKNVQFDMPPDTIKSLDQATEGSSVVGAKICAGTNWLQRALLALCLTQFGVSLPLFR